MLGDSSLKRTNRQTPLRNLSLEKKGSCMHVKCGCQEHIGRLLFWSTVMPFLKSSSEGPSVIPIFIEGSIIFQVELETSMGSLVLLFLHDFSSGFAKCHPMVTLHICQIFTAYNVLCTTLAHRAEALYVTSLAGCCAWNLDASYGCNPSFFSCLDFPF